MLSRRTSKDEALVRIQVVAERTGVPESTLRAWERRYGIPTPDRTASGYRLYGAREIEQVRRMRQLCDRGLSASDAARQLTAASSDASNDPLASARSALVNAVERFDPDALETACRQTLFLGDTLEILEHVIEPVLVEIGAKWHRGELTVAQEHFGSHRFGLLLRDLVRLVSVAEDAPRVLCASFADDDHELGLLAFAVRLAHWGFRPIFLGARTPPIAVQSAVEASHASLVALSVTIPPDRARARDLVLQYAAACGKTPWIVGGAGLARIADHVMAQGGIASPSDPKKLESVLSNLKRKKK